MLLFNPSPGQIADRMTILKLKISKSCNHHNQSVKAAQEEYDHCERVFYQYAESFDDHKNDRLSILFSGLQEQNRLQWEHEDNVRIALKAMSDPPTYEQLLAVATVESKNALGNENRAKLVRAIDELFEVAPEVKLYQ